MQRFECMKDILKFFLTLFKILNTFRILLHLRHLRQNNCDRQADTRVVLRLKRSVFFLDVQNFKTTGLQNQSLSVCTN